MTNVALNTQLRKLQLLTVNNPKILKSQQAGYLTAGLHLAPANTSGYNVCPLATLECKTACLFYAGRGAMQKVQQARVRRTLMYMENRKKFLAELRRELTTLFYIAHEFKWEPTVRLNLTSDIRWEVHGIPQEFPDYQFYDYTKIVNRYVPNNYHLTFSFSGSNLEDCRRALGNGMSVAVPFLRMPERWLGYPVVDGDADDLRFMGNGPQIIGLKAKGRLRKDPASVFLGDNHNV